MKTPTDRQGEVLAYMAAFAAEHGYPPTIREVTAALALRSSNAVADHLRALIRKGYLQRPPGAKSRSATLTQAGLDWIARQARKARRRAS